MTTIKTPLPEKQYNIVHDFTGVASSSSLNVEKTFDVIFDYLAELTAVVEGESKQVTQTTLGGVAEIVEDGNLVTTRIVVPGGWMYRSYDKSANILGCVFVPALEITESRETQLETPSLKEKLLGEIDKMRGVVDNETLHRFEAIINQVMP